MTEPCHWETREASISVEFDVCVEHRDFNSSSTRMEINGVPLYSALDSFLLSIEEVITQDLSSRLENVDGFVELMGNKSNLFLGDDAEPVGLNETESIFVMRLLAHRIILSRVRSRDYFTPVHSAALTLPR